MNIPYLLFKKVTNNFSEDRIIGRGGFGNVYKGVLDNGELIAVKLIHSVQGIDDRLFKNEVCNLSEVDHPNIVGLLGYCDEIHSEYVEHKGEKVSRKKIYRVLCFEYFPGGSLDKHLDEKSFAPSWSTCYNIIKGICEGLNCLHMREKPIFHLDLKPGNILLDSFMLPKLADFGLSRLFRDSNTRVTQKRIGTNKYMPQEYINEGTISKKNDVFSLGVVMIEIMGGPDGYSMFHEMGDNTKFKQEVLTKWGSLIEPTSEQLLQVETCIDTALCCVDFQRENRPTIGSILDTLNKTETGIPKAQLAVVSLSPSRNLLTETLNKMTAELDNITNSVAKQGPGIGDASSNVEKPLIITRTIDRVTTSSVEEELIIGRFEEKQKIFSILSHSSRNEMIILPIYGIGGIGKTTLAQLVFNDTQFSGYSRVWIYVSEKFDLYKIGNSIISQLSKKKSDMDDMEMLHNCLVEQLAGKSILIVLDDLWEKDKPKLHNLKAMLRLGKGNKVIIVTTRDKATAMNICCTTMPYKLEILTDDMCWNIIKQKSHFEDRDDKRHLEQIGRDIAIKCGGVALAARSLGYMLGDMASDQWESVRDNHIWNSSSSEDPSLTTHDVLASLRLSYLHMHKFLQFCFSYCGVFRKGHNIVKYDLIHQWIALDLMEPSTMFDSMQLGEHYITQLLGMSFLQYSKPPSVDHDEYDTLLTMHDLVHDLARAILADKANRNGNAVGSSCHYALLTDPNKPLSSPENIKALHLEYNCVIELPDSIFSPAKNLLVLDVTGCLKRKLPNSISELKQLRYLSAGWNLDVSIPKCISELSKLSYLCLRASKMKVLPDSIGGMKGLMYLDLSGCDRLSELPVSFMDLKQLVHLDLSNCPVTVSESWGSLMKLQHLDLSLSRFRYENKRRDFEVLAPVISKLTKLQYLNMSYSILPDSTEELPELEVFCKLTKLRYLNLAGCMCMTSEADIQGLLVVISTLHNLEHLYLPHSELLNSIPESIGNLTKLHTLDLSGCNVQKLPAWVAKMASLKIINMTTLDECSSNLIMFAAANPSKLKISKLEDLKSLEEAQSIKLIEKWRMYDLTLQWTVDCGARFVDDKDVLEKLVPPNTVTWLTIKGYRSLSFPTNWLMGIGKYLYNVSRVSLQDLPGCNNLAPLGQLRNLGELSLHRLDNLEELNTADSCGDLMFPKLDTLHIISCPKLRMKPCLPRALRHLFIKASDNILTSCCESVSIAPSYSVLTSLVVKGSTVPLHEWKFLQHISALHALVVRYCSDLVSCSQEVIQRLSSVKSLDLKDDILTELPTWLLELTSLQRLTISVPNLEKLNDSTRQLTTRLKTLIFRGCGSIVSLPQWLGELISLKKLKIIECKGLRSLPGSIRQLTKLRTIQIQSYYMCYNKIRKMFSTISADTDEVDIRQYVALESKRYPARRRSGTRLFARHQPSGDTTSESRINKRRRSETRLLARHQPSGDTTRESRINNIAATYVGDLVRARSTTKNLSDPPADSVSRTRGNIVHKRQGSVRHIRTRRPRQLMPATSSSGSSHARALVPTDEVDGKVLVNSSIISIDPGFIFSGAKIVSGGHHSPAFGANMSFHPTTTNSNPMGHPDLPADVVNTSTQEIPHLLPGASAATTNSLDTSSGSRINKSVLDALISTEVVATAAAMDMEDLVRRFLALSLEPS